MEEASALPPLKDRFYLKLVKSTKERSARAIIEQKRFTRQRVSDVVHQAYSEPVINRRAKAEFRPELDEATIAEVYSRPEHLSVYVSSATTDGELAFERLAAIEAVNSTGIARAWARGLTLDPIDMPDEEECIGRAQLSDALILIIGTDLPPECNNEFSAAYSAGARCVTLLQQGVVRSDAATCFIDAQRTLGHSAVLFKNVSELRTHITEEIQKHVIRSTRIEYLRTRVSRVRHSKLT
jgi:hypothetical protein